jgi:hypothetical protein
MVKPVHPRNVVCLLLRPLRERNFSASFMNVEVGTWGRMT